MYYFLTQATTDSSFFQTYPAAIAAVISLVGVIFSSVFGYISSYFGNKASSKHELKKMNANHAIRLAQEAKFERDKILRVTLQDLTQGYYNPNYDQTRFSTYFNDPEGNDVFYTIMARITAYGNNMSVQTVIYLQKALNGSHLLLDYYDALMAQAQEPLPFEIDWVRYEVNALCAILISQLRYDINQEITNPKELISSKFNNNNKNFKLFFEAGVDRFLDVLDLDYFVKYEPIILDEQELK